MLFGKSAGNFPGGAAGVKGRRQVGGVQTGKTVVYFVKSAEYGACFLVVSRRADAAVNIANEGVSLYIEC